MSHPLPVLPSGGENTGIPTPDTSWQNFLLQRERLIATMEIATCNGCDHCGTRCIDGFKVTRQEYDAILGFLNTVEQEEVRRVAEQPKELPWPGGEEVGATVRYCRYRDAEKGQCSIYPVRPTICRLFGLTAWLPCPIEAITYYPETAADVWNAYRRLERRHFEEWDKISREEKEYPDCGTNG